MKRLVLFSSLVAMLGIGIAPAQGAPAPRHLGETASELTAFANCACTAIQFGDLGASTNSYDFPYSGVITRTSFYVGEPIGAADWVQMRSFTHSGTNRVTVAGDGEKHMLQGLTPKSTPTFYERLPVSAGGVMGARYSIGNSSSAATPTYFNSPNNADEIIGTTTNLGIGDSWEETPSKKLRVNVAAVLEPDEDHDGYGDSSQDLCAGSSLGGGPCSGTLFGSDFQTALTGSGGSGFDALYVQRSIEGASTAVPFDGVVVRWRVLSNHSDDFAIRTVGPTSGAGFSVLASSEPEHLAVEPSSPVGRIATFDTRLPVPAGGYVGLATESLDIPSLRSAPGSNLVKYHDGPDGTVYSEAGTTTAWELAYDADVEPDADHDGYGDISQDSCPSSASVHEGTCPTIAPSGSAGGEAKSKDGSGTGEARANPPRILSAKFGRGGRYLVKVKVRQAGRITAKLTGKPRAKGRTVKLGKAATKRAAKAGTYTLTLRPPKAAREAKVRATLVVTLAPSRYLPAQAKRVVKLR